MASILLKNGTVLLHGEGDHITASKKDILITGTTIVRIADTIQNETAIPSNTEILDCTDKIISPGFIDTHHHTWQTQLKGRHADEMLLDYLVSGNWTASQFTDEDFYLGQLAGCLEAIWAGTTTVVDHAHIYHRPSSSRLAISATASSGLRSVFAYCPTMRIDAWNPVKEVNLGFFEPWVTDTFAAPVKGGPYGDGRVTVGLAFDLYFLPREVVTSVFQQARELGVQVITPHFNMSPSFGGNSVPMLLDSYGLLDGSLILSHANGASEKDAQLITKADAFISTTPSTELQMALGNPECWRDDLQSHSSLEIECHSNQLGSIPSEMRIGLQAVRSLEGQKYITAEKIARTISKTVEEAFNLGTIQGARALKREGELGSLQEGKLADLIILDGTSPGMICAAEHDPVAAVVLHSSPGDIEAVMIDGVFRKRDGRLVDVRVEAEARDVVGSDIIAWPELVRKLQASRKTIQEKCEHLDMEQARSVLFQTFQIDPAKVVDHL